MKRKLNIQKFLLLFSFCFVLLQVANIAITGHWFNLVAYAEEEPIHYEDADQNGYPDSIDKIYEKFAYDFYKDIVGNDVAEDCIDNLIIPVPRAYINFFSELISL